MSKEIKISLPKSCWEIIMSACIKASERPEELTKEDKANLRATYFEIKHNIY